MTDDLPNLRPRLKKISRREFAAKALTCMALCAYTGGCTSQSGSEGGRKISLGPLKSFGQSMTLRPLERLAVLRDEGGYAAVSLICTHQSCLLNAGSTNNLTLNCPCHGSVFGARGEVLTGPATENLPWYMLSVDSAQNLIVDLGQVVAPEWRFKPILP